MMSNSYWRNRELEHMKRMVRNDERIARRIREHYYRAYDEIELQIRGFYARYAEDTGITMEQARKRVSKLDIEAYSRKAKRYVQERNFTRIANQEMRLYNVTMRINRLELLKKNIELELLSAGSAEERILLEELSKHVKDEYERLSGILGQTINYNEKQIAAIVNSSFLTATWSERIWANQTALRAELDKLLHRGIIQGKSPIELARDLRKVFDTSISNSERLLRTELARVQMDVFKDSMEQANIEQYEYIAEPTACDVCSRLDGEIFYVTEMQPGINSSPMHPNCRCSSAAYVDRAEWDADLRRRGL